MSQITDQIKERVDIVEFIREYVPSLKKTGANWKARCPFHSEKTASFMVSQDKGIWHCFGCGKGGDIFGFIKEIEGIEFADALRLLARRAGVKLERQDPQRETKRQRMLDVLKLSALWYHKALLSAKSAQLARDYVKERQISDQACDEWKIGFAPDAWEGVSKYLKSRGFRDDEIASAGISSRNDSGAFYDRFRNRLMFPISDVHGSIIGFSARKLCDNDIGGKYINTPETMVYHKGSVLYGLSKAKQAIREKNCVIVVEGNIDCISSYQSGVRNVVASSGTALTEFQIRLLKRFTKNIFLAFDPDSAGQEALARGIEIAWHEEMEIKVISLPEGKDPDDLIKQSKLEWDKIVSRPKEFMDWVIESAQKNFDFSQAVGKKEGAKKILSWIARLPDMIEQTHYLQVLSEKIHVDEQTLRSAMAKFLEKSTKYENTLILPESEHDIQGKMFSRLMALMIVLGEKKEIKKELFPTEYYFNLYNNLDKLYDAHIEELPDGAQVIAREVIILSEDIRSSSLSNEDMSAEILELLGRIKENKFKKETGQIKLLIQQAEQSGDDSVVKEYMRQLNELSVNYAKEKSQKD